MTPSGSPRSPGRARGRWLLLSAIVLAAQGCEDGTGPALLPVIVPADRQEASDSVVATYRMDAGQLVLRQVLEEGGATSRQTLLPEDRVADLQRALLSVYGGAHPARDSVVELLAIHAFPHVSAVRIWLGVDSTRAWVRRWQAGARLTGQPEIDGLMEQFGLDLERYRAFDFMEHTVRLTASEPLNTVALADLFEPIDGVLHAAAMAVATIGVGRDIRARAQDAGWVLEYFIAWGLGRHTWTFGVTGDGTVIYLGSRGPRVPDALIWTTYPGD